MSDILLAIKELIDNKINKIEKEYFDIQDACIFLGLSKSTVYKFNYRKVIPYFRPSGSKKVYYHKSDLINYLSENRIMSQKEVLEKSQKHFQIKKGVDDVR